MNNSQLDDILQNAKVIMPDDDTEILADLAGYQVTKAELFAHTREPAITIWESRIKFNMACLRRFPGVTHIQILIHPEQKRLIIRPCDPDAPDSLRWAKGGGEKELATRDLLCKIFAAKVFDLMGWNTEYRYKMIGKPATYNNEVLFLFKLNDFELFVTNGKKRKSYLPEEWRDYFGIPIEQHEDAYKVDLANGYITTGKV
ncbi:MAG: integrase [Lachnospiraceae bacterium]|nr:integrase [Lachnospiraceae bacterium]